MTAKVQEKVPLIRAMAAWTRSNHGPMLEIELFVFTWLARVAMIAAVASNYDKARWVVSQFSEAGSWSPGALSLGLEVSFAVAAYFFAVRIQTRQKAGTIALIGVVTVIFAAISAIANVAYFQAHAGDEVTRWTMIQAIALGVAAPLVALANAVLSGELAGIAADKQAHETEQEAERQAHEAAQAAAEAQRAYELEMARLAVEREKQATAQERARTRQARHALELVQARDGRGSGVRSPGQDNLSAVQTRTGQASGSGQDRQAIVDHILSILSAPDGQTVTQRELASRVGRSKTTINTILQSMAADGLLQKTDDGQYVIAGRNGHHEPAAG